MDDGASETAAQFKVVLLGEGSVGKTSIMLRYTENKFNTKHVSTVQAAFASKQLFFDRQLVELQIWDTAGQERFHALSPIYYRNSNGALLVYDITDLASFDRVKNWINELRKILGDKVCIVIAGNKSDLCGSRLVEEEAARSFASSVGVPYFECSAKENIDVDIVFAQLTKAMFEKLKQQQQQHDGDSSSSMMYGSGHGYGGSSSSSLRRSNSRRSLRIVDDESPPKNKRICCKTT